MNQILECVPNFSEGRDLSVIEKLCDSFRGKPGVRLLDYTWDHDHNRCVLAVIGEPEPLRDAVVESIGSQYEGKVLVGKVNVDEEPELARRFGVMNIPTVVFLKNGQEIDRKVGVMPPQVFTGVLDANL